MGIWQSCILIQADVEKQWMEDRRLKLSESTEGSTNNRSLQLSKVIAGLESRHLASYSICWNSPRRRDIWFLYIHDKCEFTPRFKNLLAISLQLDVKVILSKIKSKTSIKRETRLQSLRTLSQRKGSLKDRQHVRQGKLIIAKLIRVVTLMWWSNFPWDFEVRALPNRAFTFQCWVYT